MCYLIPWDVHSSIPWNVFVIHVVVLLTCDDLVGSQTGLYQYLAIQLLSLIYAVHLTRVNSTLGKK